MKSRIMYIEKKSGHADDGPARIGRVTFSKSGRTHRYRGREFQSLGGSGVSGNYRDTESGEEYWVEIRKQPDRRGEPTA